MNWKAYDNYIFDLYGTLIDIRSDEHCDATWEKWFDWLDRRGVKHPSISQFRDEFFEGDARCRREALASWGFECPEIDVVPIYQELFTKYGNGLEFTNTVFATEAGYAFRTASREYMRLFPQVTGLLEHLRRTNKHAFILSNAQSSYTWPEICFFGLQNMVDDVLMSSDYRCMKPDRAFFDILLEKYDMDRSRTLMLGDSLKSDIAGADKAGIDSVHLADENSPNIFYVRAVEEILRMM